MQTLSRLIGSIKQSVVSERFITSKISLLIFGLLLTVCSLTVSQNLYAYFWPNFSIDVARYIGSFMFYGGIALCIGVAVVTRSRWGRPKQLAMACSLALCACMLVTPIASALTPLPSDKGPSNSSAYKFSVPFTEYQWIIAQFRDGTYYAVNGSDWNIMTIVEPWQAVAPWASLATNLTALEVQVLSSTTAGKILLNEVNHNYSLTVPANVTVVESKNGLVRQFINVANTQGSPYTISVDTVQSGYYLAQDSASRYINSWSSTDAGTTTMGAVRAINATGNGGEIAILNTGTAFVCNTPIAVNTKYNGWQLGCIDVSGTNSLTIKGIGQPIFNSATATTEAVNILGENTTNFRIEGIQFTNIKKVAVVVGGTHLYADKLSITNTGDQGISFHGLDGRITNSFFKNIQNFAIVDICDGFEVSNNVFEDGLGDAIEFGYSSQNGIVANNRISNFSRYAISVFSCDRLWAANSWINGSANIDINHNNIFNCNTGIKVDVRGIGDYPDRRPTNITITDNNIQLKHNDRNGNGIATYGVQVNSTDYGVIERNTISIVVNSTLAALGSEIGIRLEAQNTRIFLHKYLCA